MGFLNPPWRQRIGFLGGSVIGMLGGLIGLGGAEFRLPLLVGVFRIPSLEAVILNKAMSLVVVFAALLFRSKTVSWDTVLGHHAIILNILAGSLVGAWWAAGKAMALSRKRLDRIIMILLASLAILMLLEPWLGFAEGSHALIHPGLIRIAVGALAGFGIGTVAALLGVAGGELLIPTLVLLYGLDAKTAGSLSLAVSLPTMVVGFTRYRDSLAFSVLARERALLTWMASGSMLGAAIGSLLLGWVSAKALIFSLGILLLVSAIKTFKRNS